jgi:hypothetical protein
MDPLQNPEVYLAFLKGQPRPKPVVASDECRTYLTETVLPITERQALSELMRKNEMVPRLMGFMDDGSMGTIDVSKAMGSFGDARTKQATAVIHQLSARIPGVRASVFCVEAWALREGAEGYKPGTSLADHPDRIEVIMTNMIYYVRLDHTVMQLMAMREVIKVLGHNTSPSAWQDTKLGKLTIIDPQDRSDGKSMTGRFVVE